MTSFASRSFHIFFVLLYKWYKMRQQHWPSQKAASLWIIFQYFDWRISWKMIAYQQFEWSKIKHTHRRHCSLMISNIFSVFFCTFFPSNSNYLILVPICINCDVKQNKRPFVPIVVGFFPYCDSNGVVLVWVVSKNHHLLLLALSIEAMSRSEM